MAQRRANPKNAVTTIRLLKEQLRRAQAEAEDQDRALKGLIESNEAQERKIETLDAIVACFCAHLRGAAIPRVIFPNDPSKAVDQAQELFSDWKKKHEAKIRELQDDHDTELDKLDSQIQLLKETIVDAMTK